MVERAQRNPKIDFMLDAVVQEIRGNENGVQEVEVRNTATEKTSVIPANGVFMAIGHTPATAFLNGLVDVDSAGYITVDGASTRTSEPGVFAAGDCVDSVYRRGGHGVPRRAGCAGLSRFAQVRLKSFKSLSLAELDWLGSFSSAAA